MTSGFQRLAPVLARLGPKEPHRYAAITAHLQRDRERGTLTLKGPDLAYWVCYADVLDPLRPWVLTAIDNRIAATEASHLMGARVTDRHACPSCFGRGVDGKGRTCKNCGGAGLVCPMCRGSRWTTDGEPDEHTERAAAAACKGCMMRTSTGFQYSRDLENRTIDAHLKHPYTPPINVEEEELNAMYARAEANAKAHRERPPEAPSVRHTRRRRTP